MPIGPRFGLVGIDSSSSKTHTGRHKKEAVHLMMVAVNYTKSWLGGGGGGGGGRVNLTIKMVSVLDIPSPHQPNQIH